MPKKTTHYPPVSHSAIRGGLVTSHSPQSGAVLVLQVVVLFIFSVGMLAVLGFASYQFRVSRSSAYRELAFHIAEAGANYYQWHLAHYPTDYANGTGQSCSPTCGPYLLDYTDKDTGQVVGQYSLVVTPPLVGSTVTTITSTGWATAKPGVRRTVTVRYGIPSLARYAFLTHNDVWVGASESVSGELHANGGIRFDGTGNAPIQSAKTTYSCQPYHGCSPAQTKAGVWGSAPAGTQAFWQYPVPNVDFSSMSQDLADIKTAAQDSGIYLAPSSAQGYLLVFNNDGTVTVRRVTSLTSHCTGSDVGGASHNEDLDYNNSTVLYTQALPANGLIFVEDRVWVEGVVNGRVTVAAAKFPYNYTTAPSILIRNSITYLAQDGNHSLGLIAQRDILVTYRSANTLTIHAAMIAQNGSAQRFYFPSSCGSYYTRSSLSIYGSVASFGVWTWSWVNGSGSLVSGYANTSTTYDPNLLYSPPPSFPLSAEGYRQLSWESD